MSKMSIDAAAKKLGVSKEAIHNRVRRGSLVSVVEDGVKFVILDATAQTHNKPTQRRSTTRKVSDNDSKYYRLLEEQNQKLQLKVEKLESETKSLRDQKEQMLIEEREKIEQIYIDKDEQLKNILNAISSKFLLQTPTQEVVETVVEVEQKPQEEKLISLKRYLKNNNYSKKKTLKIKEKFKKIAKKDIRVIKVDKKYYLDLTKYDYSDLL